MIKNFLFHRVNPERDKLWDPMSVDLFDKCIKYITSKYTVITIEDLPKISSKASQCNYATISFDDGYKDNFIYALPILNKYKVKASFYVVTDSIEKNIPTWTYILDYLFQNSKISKLKIDFDFLPQDLKITELATLDEKLTYVKRLKPFLKKLSHSNRGMVLNRVNEAFNDIEIPKLMMDWTDLKEMINQGHVIGSHTVTHGMLGNMESESDVRYELEKSANEIVSKLGIFPKTISYPVGSYNEMTIKISKEIGYKMGLAVKQMVYDPAQVDLFEIPRIELYNESWWKTRLRIDNTLERIKKIIKYK